MDFVVCFWESDYFQLEEIGCKCLTFFLSLLSGRRKHTTGVRLNIWKFTFHILLKPGLENFKHYFASVWDESNCVVIWAFFVIAFLWDWKENWPFPVLWPLLFSKFAGILSSALSTASSFRIGNSSSEIPSPPQSLFVVMLPKVHLTSHSRMSGSRWMITIVIIWVIKIFKTHWLAQGLRKVKFGWNQVFSWQQRILRESTF